MNAFKYFFGSNTVCTFCTCNICETNLNKTNNGKLQIWYGTGNNGKSTLLKRVIEKIENSGKKVRVLHINEFAKDSYDLDMLEDNIGLYIIQESPSQEDLDYIIRSFEDHGNRWVRHIVCTNVKTSYEEDEGPNKDNYYDLIHFTH